MQNSIIVMRIKYKQIDIYETAGTIVMYLPLFFVGVSIAAVPVKRAVSVDEIGLACTRSLE